MTRQQPRQPGHNGHAQPSLLLTIAAGDLHLITEPDERSQACSALLSTLTTALRQDPSRVPRHLDAARDISPHPHADLLIHAHHARALANVGLIEPARQQLAYAQAALDLDAPAPDLLAAIARAADLLHDTTTSARAHHALTHAISHHLADATHAWIDALCATSRAYDPASLPTLLDSLNPSPDALLAQQETLSDAARSLAALNLLDPLAALWSSILTRSPNAAAAILPALGAALAMRSKIALATHMLDSLPPSLAIDAGPAMTTHIASLGQHTLLEAIASWARRHPDRSDAPLTLAAAGHPHEALLSLTHHPSPPAPHLTLHLYLRAADPHELPEALNSLLTCAPAQIARALLTSLATCDDHHPAPHVAMTWARALDDPQPRSFALAAAAAWLLSRSRLTEAHVAARDAYAAAESLPRPAKQTAIAHLITLLAQHRDPVEALRYLPNISAHPTRSSLLHLIALAYRDAHDIAGAARSIALMRQGLSRIQAACACYRAAP